MQTSDGRMFIAIDAAGNTCAGCDAKKSGHCLELRDEHGCDGRIFRELKGTWKVEVPNNEPKFY